MSTTSEHSLPSSSGAADECHQPSHVCEQMRKLQAVIDEQKARGRERVAKCRAKKKEMEKAEHSGNPPVTSGESKGTATRLVYPSSC